jgi:hypothetical protein
MFIVNNTVFVLLLSYVSSSIWLLKSVMYMYMLWYSRRFTDHWCHTMYLLLKIAVVLRGNAGEWRLETGDWTNLIRLKMPMYLSESKHYLVFKRK